MHEGDSSLAKEIPKCLFESLFACSKALANFVWRAVIVVIQTTAGTFERRNNLIGQWRNSAISHFIKTEINLPIRSNFTHESIDSLPNNHWRREFTSVKQTKMGVLNNCAVSQRTLASDEQLDRLTLGIWRRFLAEMIDDATTGHNAIRIWIDTDCDDHSVACIKWLRLFRKWQEQIF